jgi:hypothetical protein
MLPINVHKNPMNSKRNGNMGFVLTISPVCWKASIKIFPEKDKAINNIADIIHHMISHIRVFHNSCHQLKLLGSSLRFLFLGNWSFDRDQLLTRVSFNI